MLTATGCTGSTSSAQVAVNIVHTYRGDLVIDLLAPDGSSYRLKNSGSDSGDNINTTYTANLTNEVRNGTWRLRVQDVASADTGYLNSWSITL
jgi:subtilisin-like proprotein convertase family protein